MNPESEKIQNLKQKIETGIDESVGAMHKRCVTMPDGKRYLIYYTFGEIFAPAKNPLSKTSAEIKDEKSENV